MHHVYIDTLATTEGHKPQNYVQQISTNMLVLIHSNIKKILKLKITILKIYLYPQYD